MASINNNSKAFCFVHFVIFVTVFTFVRFIYLVVFIFPFTKKGLIWIIFDPYVLRIASSSLYLISNYIFQCLYKYNICLPNIVEFVWLFLIFLFSFVNVSFTHKLVHFPWIFIVTYSDICCYYSTWHNLLQMFVIKTSKELRQIHIFYLPVF